jgi:hypothetical protein
MMHRLQVPEVQPFWFHCSSKARKAGLYIFDVNTSEAYSPENFEQVGGSHTG